MGIECGPCCTAGTLACRVFCNRTCFGSGGGPQRQLKTTGAVCLFVFCSNLKDMSDGVNWKQSFKC